MKARGARRAIVPEGRASVQERRGREPRRPARRSWGARFALGLLLWVPIAALLWVLVTPRTNSTSA